MQHRFWKTQKTMKSFESKIQLKPANHSKKKIIHRGVFRFWIDHEKTNSNKIHYKIQKAFGMLYSTSHTTVMRRSVINIDVFQIENRKNRNTNLRAFFPSMPLFEESPTAVSVVTLWTRDATGAEELGVLGREATMAFTLGALDLSLAPWVEVLTLKFRHLSCQWEQIWENHIG